MLTFFAALAGAALGEAIAVMFIALLIAAGQADDGGEE